MEQDKPEQQSEPRICGIRIYQHEGGCFSFAVKHIGDFRLDDYEEIVLEVCDAKLVRRT